MYNRRCVFIKITNGRVVSPLMSNAEWRRNTGRGPCPDKLSKLKAMKTKATFKFVDTEAEAIAFCNQVNAAQSRYMTKRHPAHYTLWSNGKGKELKYVCWYNEKY